MNRFGFRSFAAVTIGVLMLVGVATPGVGAATNAAPAPSAVAGTYTFFVNWDNGGYQSAVAVLNADHTGSDIDGDTITWSTSGRKITITFKSSVATPAKFRGVTSKAGFNSAAHPGTTTDRAGHSGVWYAVKTPAAVASTVAPNHVAGTYTVHGIWTGRGNWFQYSLTLNTDHTGSDEYGDTITWSTNGRAFTMTLNGGTATYQGTKSKAGFDNLLHPGTMTNTTGRSGIWYAVKTG